MELQIDQRLGLAILLSLLLHLAGFMALPSFVPGKPFLPPILQVTLVDRIEHVRKALAAVPVPAQTHARPVPVQHKAKPHLQQDDQRHVVRSPHAVPVVETGSTADAAPLPPPLSEAVPDHPSVAPATPAPAPLQPAPDLAAPVPEDALANYGASLSLLIAQYREYPRLAQLRGWEGKVLLRLSIGPGAKLLDVAVSRSSGHEVLDDRALQMVKRVASLPRPPDGLHGKAFTVVVPVVFQLDE